MSRLSMTVDPGALPFTLRNALPTFKKHVGPPVSRTVLMMQRSARRKAPKAMSVLTNSIFATMALDGLGGEVTPGVDYAEAVEDGTGLWGPDKTASGKMPPIESIEDWIKVRRVVPDQPHMDTRDLAFVIARAIAARGTAPQPYLQPAFDEERPAGEKRIYRGIKKAVRELES
ncbi:MAG: hypothetical protein OEY11_12280 [Gammaproteobacteria bacterium]|nr:hypothetical protein [Gammaproteobacteria bacterium]